MNPTTRNKTAVFFLSLILPTIIVLRIKSFFQIGSRDAGTFAYIGDMILQGKIPYRDIWDHKAPFIYYLNALLFKVFGSQYRVIAVFEVFWLFLASICIYKLSRSMFKRGVSICVSFIFAAYISSLELSGGFGMTETYSMLPAVLAIFAAAKYGERSEKLLLFTSGLAVAAAFLFRQTGLFVAAPIALYLTLNCLCEKRSFLSLFSEYLVFVLGILIPIGACFLYFSLNASASDFISQVFSYNFIYAKKDITTYLFPFDVVLTTSSILKSFLGKYPFLLAFGAGGILCGLSGMRKRVGNKGFAAGLGEYGLFIALFSWLLLVLYCAGLGGRFYGHYYVEIIPPLALLSGYGINYFYARLKAGFRLISFILIFLIFSPLLSSFYIWGGGTLVLIKPVFRYIYNTNPRLINQMLEKTLNYDVLYVKNSEVFLNEKYIVDKDGFPYVYWKSAVAKWLTDNTSKNDFIYFWGAEAGLNFLIDRKNPSKYIYLYPLETPSYAKKAYLEEFIADLKQKKPKFIVDTSSTNGFIPSLSLKYVKNGDFFYDRKLLLPAIKFINNNYVYETTVDGWDIYRLR